MCSITVSVAGVGHGYPTTLPAYAGHSGIFGDYGNPRDLRFGANWLPLKNWPVKKQGAIVEDIINDPQFKNVHFDISWDEVAKYIVATPESTKNAAAIVNRYPDRFLFGTDEVAPLNQEQYLCVYQQYASFWRLLTPEASEKVRKGNYVRLFDEARRRVRNWEAANSK